MPVSGRILSFPFLSFPLVFTLGLTLAAFELLDERRDVGFAGPVGLLLSQTEINHLQSHPARRAARFRRLIFEDDACRFNPVVQTVTGQPQVDSGLDVDMRERTADGRHS